MNKINRVVCVVQNRIRGSKVGLINVLKSWDVYNFTNKYIFNANTNQFILGENFPCLYISRNGISIEATNDWDVVLIDDETPIDHFPEVFFSDHVAFLVHSFPDDIITKLIGRGADCVKVGRHEDNEIFGFSRLGRIFEVWNEDNTFKVPEYLRALNNLINWFDVRLESTLNYLHKSLVTRSTDYKGIQDFAKEDIMQMIRALPEFEDSNYYVQLTIVRDKLFDLILEKDL